LLIAYSSVAHIGLVLRGFITLSYWGVNGCYFIIIAHGLCSSGLFCLANISYERIGSRRLLVNKGLINFIPSLSLWWFLLCSSNISAPPSLNLLGEISLINRLIAWSWLSIILLILFSFFRASYRLYLFAFRQHGILYSRIYSYSNNNLREFLLLFLHWLPLNLLIMKSNLILI
jgi:NADH-ubiquinone oxidoreductase chain 4